MNTSVNCDAITIMSCSSMIILFSAFVQLLSLKPCLVHNASRPIAVHLAIKVLNTVPIVLLLPAA